MQQLLVDGLKVDHIVMRGGDAFLGGGFDGLTRHIADGADRDDGHVRPFAQSTATPNGQQLHLVLPVAQLAFAARIADDEGATVGLVSREHEVAEVDLVEGGGDDHVRDGAEVSQVEGAVVRDAILTHEARAVEAEHDVQFQYGCVVDHLIIGAL